MTNDIEDVTDMSSSNKDGWTEDKVENITEKEIQDDLKALEEMKSNAFVPKVKGLRHSVSINAAIKRKHKNKLQRLARKKQRGR